ncbi:hypothetical protein ACEN88_25500 [Massilia sp. CT11-108]|uniref:hypothetical protein n=1 Tax=Massilia sp. CT11-108 TaxID=3393900 RepID=UPI0039A785D7
MKTLTVCALALLAAGCAATPTPRYDMQLGAAVREARLAMTIDPAAGSRPDEVKGIDGRAAKEAIKRYRDSFKEPPPVVNVVNIGGALGAGNGGSGGR